MADHPNIDATLEEPKPRGDCYDVLMEIKSGSPEVERPVCRTRIPLDKVYKDGPPSYARVECLRDKAIESSERKKQNMKAGCGERLRRTHDDLSLSGPRPMVTTTSVRPVAVNPEDAACTPLSHHQSNRFDAITSDCRLQSTKLVRNPEDITKTGPTQETASSAPSTSELVIIFHRPLPDVLNRPPHYRRDGTFPMNVSQSCINFACYAPAVEATTGRDDCEPLLCLMIVPEQESLRGNEDTELAL